MKEYCSGGYAWVVLIIGLLYLLSDLQMIQWWNISWWTVMFVLWGLMGVMGNGKK